MRVLHNIAVTMTSSTEIKLSRNPKADNVVCTSSWLFLSGLNTSWNRQWQVTTTAIE